MGVCVILTSALGCFGQGSFELKNDTLWPMFLLNGWSDESPQQSDQDKAGMTPVVTSNPDEKDTGIVWGLNHRDELTLVAFKSSSLQDVRGEWKVKGSAKFCVPSVINGKAYVCSYDGDNGFLTIFGQR